MALLVFIHRRITETGICPTYADMAEAMGLSRRSVSSVCSQLQLLRKDGWVRWTPHQSRSVEVLRAPGGTLSAPEVAWCHGHAEQVRRLMDQAAS